MEPTAHDDICDRRRTADKKEMCLKINSVSEKYGELRSLVLKNNSESVESLTACKKDVLGNVALRFSFVWPILILLLASVVGGGLYGYAQSENMKSTNATQDTQIQYIQDEISEIKEDNKEILREIRELAGEVRDLHMTRNGHGHNGSD